MAAVSTGTGMGDGFDVIVIGGGVLGCGIARDATLRGLRVALIEQEDFGAGTSAASTRLVHGGLRYLEQYDFGLVRQDLAEREHLLRLAPHLVQPLPFLVPFFRRGLWYRSRLRAGMYLYDLLSYDRSLPGHRFLSAAEARQREPRLAEEGLQGAMLYYDAQVPLAERLCIENVVEAVDGGALALNHTRVTGIMRDGTGAVVGVTAFDRLREQARQLRARVVVNATGPWLDELLGLIEPGHPPLLRRTKGVHLVTPQVTRDAVVLFTEADDRLFFIVPWLGYSYVGTTDTDFDGDPAHASADAQDVAYLLREIAGAFPDVDWQPIYYTTAGVRALVRREGVHAGAVSRRHRVVDHAARGAPGLISVVGGKLTAYRGIAEEVVDAVGERLEIRAPTWTRERLLPGAVGYGPGIGKLAEAEGKRLGLERDQTAHLVRVYGARYREIFELVAARPRLGRRLGDGLPDCLAQVQHAVEREGARTLADILLRRTMLGLQPGHGLSALDTIAAEAGTVLGWDEAQVAREKQRYLAALAPMRPPDRQ